MKRILAALLALAALTVLLPGCAGEEIPEPKALRWAFQTPMPDAADFYPDLPDGASVSFAEEDPFADAGLWKKTEVLLIYRSAGGKQKQVCATLEIVMDESAPIISGVKEEIIAYVGEAVAYREGVTVSDDCDGTVLLEIDDSAVDTTRAGVYDVTYKATDRAGKTATVQSAVHVYEERVTEEMLWSVIDPLIEKLQLSEMDKAGQVQAIWEYVHKRGTITYTDTSDKADWMRAAYFAVRDQKGDCFTYYSLAKAFFERLGIVNLDIHKYPRPEHNDKNAHYWSMVNIGTADAPVWYHFDATRISGQSWEAYLMTDAQIAYLREKRPDLYDTDLSSCPKTPTREWVIID